MKKLFPAFSFVLVLFLVTACGGSSEVVGVYHLDVSKVPDAANLKGSIELKADGTVAMSMEMPPNVAKTTGTWKVDGASITMTVKQGDQEQVVAAKIADGAITLTQPPDDKTPPKVFRRK